METKKLSPEEFRNLVVEHLTLQWLKQNNLDPADPNTPAIEIDENEETSQLNAWKLTAEEAYDYIIEALEKIDEMGYEMEDSEEEEEEEEEGDSDLLRDYINDNLGNGQKIFAGHPIPELKVSGGAVDKSTMISIFMRTGPGVPTYVSDVREWLAEVDSLEIPDDAEVEGELFLTYDKDILTGERSECLYCGDKQDILLTVHDCKGGEEDI